MNILKSNTQISGHNLSCFQYIQNIANDYYSPVTTSCFSGERRTVILIEEKMFVENKDFVEGMGAFSRALLTITIIAPILFAIIKLVQSYYYNLGVVKLAPGQHKMKVINRETNNVETKTVETKGNICLFEKAQFPGMKQATKCLLMSQGDYDAIEEKIHHGAFGNDYRDFPEVHKRVTWKIPADLLGIEGYQPDTISNPVGDYKIIDDLGLKIDDPFKIKGQSATKMRIDFRGEKNVVSVHHFEFNQGVSTRKIAGISTGNFFKDFNLPTIEEMTQVTEMMADLANLGIEAFFSNSTHHAIIFHSRVDGNSPELMTPQLFAALLRQEDNQIFESIQKAANRPMEEWRNCFVQAYGVE